MAHARAGELVTPDVPRWVRALYALKRRAPAPLLGAARRIARAIPRAAPERIEDAPPWTSPDVWARVVSLYASRPSPTVFEYGTGASTLAHVRQLLAGGGRVVGVEADADWFAKVQLAIDRLARSEGTVSPWTRAAVPGGVDATTRLTGRAGAAVVVELRLRPIRAGSPGGADPFVRALDAPVDVVIVDGEARKACVRHALDERRVRPGGGLVLFEAGRGVDGWLGLPGLGGEFDYRPEVAAMTALGGEVVDGAGLDRWPGVSRRRSSISVSHYYPLEACLLVMPADGRKLEGTS